MVNENEVKLEIVDLMKSEVTADMTVTVMELN